MTPAGRAAILGILGVPALVIAASCTIFNGLVADGPDASASTPAPGCARKLPPLIKPGVDDGGVGFTVVTRHFAFGGAGVGFDLDDQCACLPVDAGSCKPPQGVALICDEEGGVDNAAAPIAADLGPVLEALINGRLEKGDGNILIKVDDYNGGPDDERVKVSVFRSQGPAANASEDCAPIDRVPEPVNFETPQHWSIDALSIANRGLGGLCDPEQVAQGYVVGNKLVVTMGALSIHPFVRFGGSGVIVGDIQNDAGQRRLVNVIVAGRWNAEDALRSFGRYETDLLGGGSGAAPICQQPEFRQTLAELQSLLCAARDTTSSPGQDGRDLPCTDVSTVVLLDTAPAELGPTVAASSAPSIDCPTELVTCP